MNPNRHSPPVPRGGYSPPVPGQGDFKLVSTAMKVILEFRPAHTTDPVVAEFEFPDHQATAMLQALMDSGDKQMMRGLWAYFALRTEFKRFAD